MFTQLNLWGGAIMGAIVMFGFAWSYNTFVDNPSVVRETRLKVESEARERTLAAINEVNDNAERARAMRRYCRDSGRLYDFSTGQCR